MNNFAAGVFIVDRKKFDGNIERDAGEGNVQGIDLLFGSLRIRLDV
jgi:hypothetical protein